MSGEDIRQVSIGASSLKALYHFFKSARLAVVLILLITVLSVLATTLVRSERFFRSAVFLIPVALFTVNLGVCAVDRFVRRARSTAKKRYGPDLIHLGLLLLIIGGLATTLTRNEKTVSLAAGEQAPLSKEYAIKLLSLELQRYENGSPKAWISTVRVLRGGREVTPAYPIRVNHPLRLKGLAVYQEGWTNDGTLTLRDQEGNEVSGRPGQGFQEGQSFWLFADILSEGNTQRALFKEYRGRSVASTRSLAPADRIGPFTVLRMESRPVTGLKAVNDPGFILVIPAFIVVVAGLLLTYVQKNRGDKS